MQKKPEIEPGKWDSRFFGCRIGRLILSEALEFDPELFNLQVANGGYELVYVIVNNKWLNQTDAVKAHLRLMDIQITMTSKLNREAASENHYEFLSSMSRDDLSACHAIAEQTAKVSRFYHEPVIGPEKTIMMYKQWVDNALAQKYGDGIVVTRDQSQQITGLMIVNSEKTAKTGICDVIGVQQHSKRKGIGARLWRSALNYWTNETDFTSCKVTFSANNLQSFNFHLKVGFDKIEVIRYVYHYRAKQS